VLLVLLVRLGHLVALLVAQLVTSRICLLEAVY
jgi:hypothetical protein